MKVLLTKPEICRILKQYLEFHNPEYVVSDDMEDGWLNEYTYELWFERRKDEWKS